MRKSAAQKRILAAASILMLGFALIPIYYLILIAIKPLSILFDIPPKFFFEPTWGCL